MAIHIWVKLTPGQITELRLAADSHLQDLTNNSGLPGYSSRIRGIANAEQALVRAAQRLDQPLELTDAELATLITAGSLVEAGEPMEMFRDGRRYRVFARAMAKLRAMLRRQEQEGRAAA